MKDNTMEMLKTLNAAIDNFAKRNAVLLANVLIVGWLVDGFAHLFGFWTGMFVAVVWLLLRFMPSINTTE